MLKIDYWYTDGRKAPAVYATATFYPNDGIWRGNVFNADGEMIGDYYSDNSVEIAQRFPGIFDD